MKNKGFTLIELLAVIVILAIIALIAVPAVLNIIEESRKGAAEATARNIVSTAKTYYMAQTMQEKTTRTIDLSGTTLKYDGDQASKGYIAFTDGTPNGKMYISGYCVEIELDGTVTSKKVASDECEIVIPIVYTKYEDGTPLFFNPKDNVKCKSATSSATGTNDTCMKWYAFLDSEDSSTVNLILDHNTTENVAWNEDWHATTPDTINAKLQEDIANWNAAVKSTARIISATEVHKIAPTNPRWGLPHLSYWYYLHNGTQTQYKGEAGSNTYAWMFDNTDGCETSGCNINASGAKGYWTSDYCYNGFSWYVDYKGRLCFEEVGDDSYGLRPVIAVDKKIFE